MNELKDSAQSKKRQQVLETAQNLFMRYGIKRVTIEEICRVAGVSKMTFYKYFNNKNDIAIRVLDNIFTEGERRYNEIMAQDIPYSEKVKDIIKLKMDASQDASNEMLKDLWHNPVPEVAEFIQKKSLVSLQQFLNDMILAQKKGEIRADINPHFILYIIGQMQEMTDDEKLLNMYDSVQDLASEIINFFFYGILTREKS